MDGLGEKGSHLLRCVLSCAVCELSSGPGYIHRPPTRHNDPHDLSPESHQAGGALIHSPHFTTSTPLSRVFSMYKRCSFLFCFLLLLLLLLLWVGGEKVFCLLPFFLCFFARFFPSGRSYSSSTRAPWVGQPDNRWVRCVAVQKKNKCKKRTPHTHTHRHNIVVTQNRAKEMGQTRPRHSAFGGCHRNLCRRSPSRPLGVFPRWPCGTRTRVREREGVSKKKKNDPQMKRNFTVGFCCCCCCCRGASDHRNPAHWPSVHFRATTRARGRLIVSFGWLWI